MSTVSSLAARVWPITIALALLLTGAAIAADHPLGSVNFTLGYKHLSSDWALGTPNIAGGDSTIESNPSQPALGVETSWGRRGWPVSIAFDVMHSYDDGLQQFPLVNLGVDTIPAAAVRRRASTLEIGIGVRRAWTLKSWEPYIGGGGSLVHATMIDEVINPAIGTNGAIVGRQHGHDSSFGYWVGGGLTKRVGPRFHIGLTARYTRATLSMPDTRVVGEFPNYRFPGGSHDVEAGGHHIGLVMGWSFPDAK